MSYLSGQNCNSWHCPDKWWLLEWNRGGGWSTDYCEDLAGPLRRGCKISMETALCLLPHACIIQKPDAAPSSSSCRSTQWCHLLPHRALVLSLKTLSINKWSLASFLLSFKVCFGNSKVGSCWETTVNEETPQTSRRNKSSEIKPRANLWSQCIDKNKTTTKTTKLVVLNNTKSRESESWVISALDGLCFPNHNHALESSYLHTLWK